MMPVASASRTGADRREDARVAEGVVGEDAGLAAGHRLRGRAQRGQQFGENRGRDHLADRQQQVAVRAAAHGADQAQQRVGRVRIGLAAHRADHDDDLRAAALRFEHARCRDLAQLRRRERRAAELLDDDRSTRDRGEASLLDQQFEDLHAVGGRAFAQLIADDPQHGSACRRRCVGLQRATCTTSVFSTSSGVTMPRSWKTTPGAFRKRVAEFFEARRAFGFDEHRLAMRACGPGRARKSRRRASSGRLSVLRVSAATLSLFAVVADAAERADLRHHVVQDRRREDTVRVLAGLLVGQRRRARPGPRR